VADQITQQLVQLDAKVASINEEIKILDQENESLAEQQKANIVKRTTLRKEREGLSKLRDSAAVSQRIATHEEAAEKARTDAQSLQLDATALTAQLKRQSDELAAKLAEVDALIAKTKEAAPAA
jgi:chromosome segregation ATPase